MQKKDILRKKYYIIRKKNYFDIEPNFFDPFVKLIKKNYKKKIINLSSYYPSDFEVNTLKLLEKNFSNKIKIILPVIRGKNSINFYKWKNKEVLKVNKFGMLEPFIQLDQIIPDVMLVPLLSYDKNKNRLGYGKGFYDRLI